MKKNNLLKKTIGLVYDVPNSLFQTKGFHFPDDGMSEWESQDTIDIICKTWKEIGCDIIMLPVDEHFLNQWSQEAHKCDVIHSLVEGFGSLARESWIPSLCELTGVPCIGSNPFVHSVCMNKSYVKMICNELKIPTAKSYIVHNMNDISKIKNEFFERPHFIKPNAEGSGMGIDAKHSISNHKKQTTEIIYELLKIYQDGILIESYLSGSEFTTGIIGCEKHFLPVAQIEVPDGVYGFANKSKDYLSEKVTFPKLSHKMQNNFKHYSEKLFSYMNMADMVRLDWKCDDNNKVYFLEANTLPGLSKIYSVLPLMAKEAGIQYADLLQILFESAYERREHRSLWYAQRLYKNVQTVTAQNKNFVQAHVL